LSNFDLKVQKSSEEEEEEAAATTIIIYYYSSISGHMFIPVIAVSYLRWFKNRAT
jgi:hypothetical protein